MHFEPIPPPPHRVLFWATLPPHLCIGGVDDDRRAALDAHRAAVGQRLVPVRVGRGALVPLARVALARTVFEVAEAEALLPEADFPPLDAVALERGDKRAADVAARVEDLARARGVEGQPLLHAEAPLRNREDECQKNQGGKQAFAA